MILRPNLAQDAPPTSVEVGGFRYPVNVDYRVWIGIWALLDDWIDNPADDASKAHNAGICEQVQCMAFGGVLADEDAAEVMAAVAGFLQGYPADAPVEAEGGEALFRFDTDLHAIILAIRNQSGIDLSYRRVEPFHWWEFLLEFQSLCGDHLILRLMEARAYRGNDPELLRRRERCRLPHRQRTEDRMRMAEINRLFSGA